MIVAMQEQATEEQIQQVIERLIGMGFEVHRSTGARQTVLGAVGARHEFDIRDIEVLPGVGEAHRISSPYKLVARSFRPEGTVVKFKRGVIGGYSQPLKGEFLSFALQALRELQITQSNGKPYSAEHIGRAYRRVKSGQPREDRRRNPKIQTALDKGMNTSIRSQ